MTTAARILVVDDDPALLQALPETIRLRMEGIVIDTAESAAAALDHIEATDYDAIVSDIKMPGIDGLALLGEIRLRRPETPTLLITGHGEHDLAVRALRGGAYDFIAKPIDRDYLVASLTRAIGARHLKRKIDEQQAALEQYTERLEQMVDARTHALRFLADASRVLTGPLDSVARLQTVARMTVPRIADWCVAYAIEGGAMRRAEVACADARLQAEEIASRFPVERAIEPHRMPLLTNRKPELLTDGGADATGTELEQELRASARLLGTASVVLAPLVARAEPVGLLVLGTNGSGRHYGADYLTLIEDLCQRAALAIDNARLYEHEHGIAETLQRSLLPSHLPQIPGITAAARYMPAKPEAVGGDWYDLFMLAGGRLGIVMGDVAGRGVQAAALMGQLRNTARAFAGEGYPPSVVLSRLASLIESGQMVTLQFVIFDPASWVVQYANAGHPPPLVVAPDGSTRFLDGGSPPLGPLSTRGFRDYSVTLSPGSVLILYTDGLVDFKGAHIDEGLERLRETARAVRSADVEALANRIVTSLWGDRQSEDDLAFLVLRAEVPDPHRLQVQLPAAPSSLPLIRHVLRRWLVAADVPEDDVYDITVACCEACANVIEHAYGLAEGEVRVEATASDGSIDLTVRDRGGWTQSRGQYRGRGLQMIQALMHDVNVVPGADGTSVRMRYHRRRIVDDKSPALSPKGRGRG